MANKSAPWHLVIYDAHCVICNSSVSVIAKNDKSGRIFFTNAETDTGKKYAGMLPATITPEMSVAFVSGGQVYVLSDAVIQIARKLRFPCSVLKYLKVLPKKWRDAIYLFVANNRFRIFRRRSQCILPGKALKDKIL
ncbi:MAG: DCC1-like thiol-disulfide oxidoreductase family protein [Bacteroidales bacterium]|nr:DCC1-like thiol-disulfide oxidoreductase family protein [Bacteroidales bacterium]